jgi:hypothetical protein
MTDYIDNEIDIEDVAEAEAQLRRALSWARRRSAELRHTPVEGRAASLIATHVEEALYRLLYPVP